MHNTLSDTEKVEDSVAVEYTRNGNERNFNLNAMQVSVCASHKLVGMLRFAGIWIVLVLGTTGTHASVREMAIILRR